MAMKNGRGIEILVHATARSTAGDDARYRAIAQAYLTFEPANKIALEDPLTDEASYQVDDGDEESAQSQLYDELLGATPKTSTVENPEMTRRRSPDTDYGSFIASSNPPISSRLELLTSPQASFNSILDNRNSPGLKKFESIGNRPLLKAPEDMGSSQPEDSWIPPPSVLSDSHPQSRKYEDSNLYSSPTTVLQTLLDQSHRLVSLSPKITSGVSDLPSDEPTSSPPLLLVPSEDTSGVSIMTPGAVLSSSPASSPVQLPPYASSGVDLFRDCPLPSVDPSSSAINHNLLSSNDITSTKRRRLDVESKDTTLEAHPPPPRTSTSDLSPSSLVTKPLRNLAENLHYRPSSQTRSLRPLERGYWVINCCKWPEDVKERSWAFLKGYIEKGNAGWGVWCTRDEKMDSLRAYCWGEVVGHIYRLLHLVSERKLKGSGAQWVDGGGEVVITMV